MDVREDPAEVSVRIVLLFKQPPAAPLSSSYEPPGRVISDIRIQ